MWQATPLVDKATPIVDMVLLDGIQEDLLSRCFLSEYLATSTFMFRSAKGGKHRLFSCSPFPAFLGGSPAAIPSKASASF